MTPLEIQHLRSVDEDTVAAALKDAYVQLPINDLAGAVELWNLMLDELIGEDNDKPISGTLHPEPPEGHRIIPRLKR